MSNEEERSRSIASAIAMIAECYRGKWAPGAASVNVWADILWELEPHEIADAVRAHCATEKWPPTPSEIRGRVPRFCRCGRCAHCHHRAVQRAMKSGPGADLDTPLHEQPAARGPSRINLTGAPERRMLGP